LLDKLLKEVVRNYSKKSYPCLYEQFLSFKKTKPLKGVKILHAAPIFKNSLPKLLPLIVSEAVLHMIVPRFLPFDPRVVQYLQDIGMPFLKKPSSKENFDIFMDCSGSLAEFQPKLGAVELTRSGVDYYLNKKYPVYSVDHSEIKAIEDQYGTSDGFIRAMERLGLNQYSKYRFMVFGYGKVGSGIVKKLERQEVKAITIIDKANVFSRIKEHPTVDCCKKADVLRLLDQVDFVVTATGVKHVIQDNYGAEKFIASRARLINMGAEDEYGPAFPEKRVENNKKPLNFLLEEPTRLEFLDPVFALYNECAALLAQKDRLANGIHPPPKETEEKIIKIFREKQTSLQKLMVVV